MLTFGLKVQAVAWSLPKQNTLAALGFPGYLALRPMLKRRGVLRAQPDGPWVLGGHSGRLYADNVAALHQQALASGQRALFVVSDPVLGAHLQQRGYEVLQRNSLAARIAIENAELLAYSHGLTDLDHVLGRLVALRGLKVHLNHSMNFIKAGRPVAPLEADQRTRRPEPFNFLLAVSERERENFLRSFPGFDARVVLGGGAHLDPFMRARGQTPARTLVYFPTFRDGAATAAALDRNVARLASSPRLHAFLEREDLRLEIVGHVNRNTQIAHSASARVRWLPSSEALPAVLRSAALISDYSGMLCDQLALARPTIFFPFDKTEYLTERELYVDYDELAWGPQVHDIDQLLELLESGRYRDLKPYAERRAHWEAECFPRLSPDYAASTFRTVQRLIEERRRLL